MNQLNGDEIRTRPTPDCNLCGTKGQDLHRRLKDRMYGANGEWDLKRCPNPQCGLIWLDPMPLEADIGKAYQSYYTHKDDSFPNDDKKSFPKRLYSKIKAAYLSLQYGYKFPLLIWERYLWPILYLHPVRRAAVDSSVFFLSAQPDGRLLEVGCGSGQKLKKMQELGWEVEGIDFDRAAVNNARSKGLKVCIGTLESQSYPNDYFDAVTMNHLIEHVYDPLKLVSDCYRILKPGGRLVAMTPNAKSWGSSMFKEDLRGWEPPRHLHIFTPLSIRSLCEKAGFKKLKVTTTVSGLGYYFIASRSLKRQNRYSEDSIQTRSTRFWASGMQFVGWAILKVWPHAGEGVVLVAEK